MTEEERLAVDEAIRSAAGVGEVLGNEYLVAAFQAVEKEQLAALDAADLGDEKAILLVKARLDAVKWLHRKLTNVVDRGKVAKARLEEESTKE